MAVRTEITPYSGGFRITTSVDGGNGWGVGVTFPTERGAQMVATAIELAAADPYYDDGV
jgi:hypothetical protein